MIINQYYTMKHATLYATVFATLFPFRSFPFGGFKPEGG